MLVDELRGWSLHPYWALLLLLGWGLHLDGRWHLVHGILRRPPLVDLLPGLAAGRYRAQGVVLVQRKLKDGR